jgi:sugar lactone lactonase YvrE
MCVNAEGELLVATSEGLQIFDPRGRILVVLPRPKIEDQRPNYVTFGGKDRKTLYLATAGTIYKRPAKNFQGVDPARPAGPNENLQAAFIRQRK